jgi:hypothetical protein
MSLRQRQEIQAMLSTSGHHRRNARGVQRGLGENLNIVMPCSSTTFWPATSKADLVATDLVGW